MENFTLYMIIEQMFFKLVTEFWEMSYFNYVDIYAVILGPGLDAGSKVYQSKNPSDWRKP